MLIRLLFKDGQLWMYESESLEAYQVVRDDKQVVNFSVSSLNQRMREMADNAKGFSDPMVRKDIKKFIPDPDGSAYTVIYSDDSSEKFPAIDMSSEQLRTMAAKYNGHPDLEEE